MGVRGEAPQIPPPEIIRRSRIFDLISVSLEKRNVKELPMSAKKVSCIAMHDTIEQLPKAAHFLSAEFTYSINRINPYAVVIVKVFE